MHARWLLSRSVRGDGECTTVKSPFSWYAPKSSRTVLYALDGCTHRRSLADDSLIWIPVLLSQPREYFSGVMPLWLLETQISQKRNLYISTAEHAGSLGPALMVNWTSQLRHQSNSCVWVPPLLRELGLVSGSASVDGRAGQVSSPSIPRNGLAVLVTRGAWLEWVVLRVLEEELCAAVRRGAVQERALQEAEASAVERGTACTLMEQRHQ